MVQRKRAPQLKTVSVGHALTGPHTQKATMVHRARACRFVARTNILTARRLSVLTVPATATRLAIMPRNSKPCLRQPRVTGSASVLARAQTASLCLSHSERKRITAVRVTRAFISTTNSARLVRMATTKIRRGKTVALLVQRVVSRVRQARQVAKTAPRAVTRAQRDNQFVPPAKPGSTRVLSHRPRAPPVRWASFARWPVPTRWSRLRAATARQAHSKTVLAKQAVKIACRASTRTTRVRRRATLVPRASTAQAQTLLNQSRLRVRRVLRAGIRAWREARTA